MEMKAQPMLSFSGMEILHVDYDITSPVHRDAALKVSVEPRAIIRKANPRLFNVVINLEVCVGDECKLRLVSLGRFMMSVDITEGMKKQFINVNAVAIMFPYVRSFVTTLTANIGSLPAPIILPPQFFEGKVQIEEVD